MQNQSELREGWIITSLSNISHKITDGSHNPPKKQLSGKLMISSRNIEIDGINFINARFIAENDFQKEKNRADIEPGDVLLSIVGTIGKSIVVPEDLPEFTIQRSIALIKTKINPIFLSFYFRSDTCQDYLQQNSKGTSQKGIYLNQLKIIPIPLPPLSEQHRIVSVIEALFAHLDAANERLDRVPDIMKRFRQSVLAAACDGRLTEAWREENPQVEESSEYLEKIKVEKSTKPNKHEKFGDVDYPNSNIIPDKWSGVKIGEIETFIGSGITPKGGRSVYVNEGIPFIRSQNVYPKGLILDDIAYVTPEMHQKMKRTHVFSGDVLLNITGASIGRSTYVPENFGEANVNQHVCIIRCGWWILPRYFSMFLNSDKGQSQIFKMQTGQTREGLNYTQIRNMFVALPPLPEQHEIVQRVDALFALADSIEAKVATARERTEKMRQSIFAKAFSGELVKTEAELARQEGRDYEPADVLLERIKAEQGKSGKKGKAAK